MSFTSDVKEELSRIELSDNTKRAQLSALLQILASINISSDGMKLTITTTNGAVIRRIATDLNYLYQIKCKITYQKQINLDKKTIYSVVVSEKVEDILFDLDLWTDKGLQDHPRMMFLNNDEMIRSYLAGCFMSSGSISSPTSTSYHMEIVANSEEHGQFLIKLLDKFYIKAKMTTRRNDDVVYLKSAEMIADFLNVIGAGDALLEFEDIRIQRDFVNSIQRLENVKIANEKKILAVADEQYETVSFLLEHDLLKQLSEKDQEIAMLRYENPDASLMELSDLLYIQSKTTLSKSGIRHRFEKITALAEKYKERQNNE